MVFTTASIQRGFWPVAQDVLCLAGLGVVTSMLGRNDRVGRSMPLLTTVGAALVIQAMLLRVLGPNRAMTVLDVFHLHYPAVISFFWSGLGATLTLLSRRIRSRTLWSTGAVVLVVCAAKLMLFDFGSLGELTNILAVIAAGLVFLLVSWLAPLPPRIEASPLPNSAT